MEDLKDKLNNSIFYYFDFINKRKDNAFNLFEFYFIFKSRFYFVF